METEASRGATDEASPSLVRRPWFWVAVGVAVVGGTVAALFATRKDTYPAATLGRVGLMPRARFLAPGSWRRRCWLAGARGACSTTHDCRPGTLFLDVHFAPYTGVEQVYVQVTVTGEALRTKTFDVAPRAAGGGGIEVGFATYPAGKHADLIVRLDGASGPLATRMLGVELTGDCAAVDVSFTGTDGGAGAGGHGGAAGTSGGGVGGGAGGGPAGAGGGPAGAGGSAAGASGGGGLVGGGGGGMAGGVSTGGVAGSVSAGGRGGGGVAGSVSAGGRGGGSAGAAGGAPGGRGGAAGGVSGCTPTGAENCFNFADDDCDGNVDCMDSDCGPIATCVALDPALGQLGVVLPDPQTPCPPNYTTATTINRGQVQAQCSGCSCAPPATSCVAPFSDYPSYDACTNNPNAGTMVSSYSSSFACSVPTWNDFNQPVPGSVFGVSVGQMMPSYAGCTAGGTATASTPTWTTTNRFCAATMRGGGCGVGSACLPAIANNPPRCAMASGSAVCPNGTQRTDWYTGLHRQLRLQPLFVHPTVGRELRERSGGRR